MPTYVQTADNSDLTPTWANTSVFDKDMSTGASGNGNFTFTVPASSTRSSAFITLSGIPDSDGWENGGTQTVEIDVNMGDADVTCRCRIVRLNSTGTILQSGSFTSTQVMSASRTFSPVAPTWTGGEEACGNRLAIEFEWVESVGMNATMKLNIRTTTAEVITDITENAGSCAVGIATQPLIVNQPCIV